MTRLAILLPVVLLVAACGTPCSRAAAAESAADEKGKGCNSSRNAWAPAKLQRCESNLNACSPNDTRQLELYASCLNALPACMDGQRLSWEIQRSACFAENILFKLSGGCSQGVF